MWWECPTPLGDVAPGALHHPTGGPQNDIIGTSGDDTLPGTDGDDVIDGQGGNDDIDGGGGTDICKGGSGHNTIVNCES